MQRPSKYDVHKISNMKNLSFALTLFHLNKTLNKTNKINPKKHLRLSTYNPYHQKKRRCYGSVHIS